jgi:diacylglycerol O-acyltransferase
MQLTPPLQNLWYRAVADSEFVQWVYRELIGARVARALSGVVVNFRPDVVVSTYPLGTAGLSWLRRRGQLVAPVVAVLSDFAPHAFWIYPEMARYLVLNAHGRIAMGTLAPGVPVSVCAPLVAPSFRPPGAGDTAAARQRLGIPRDALAVLVSCGALGLGSVSAAADSVLAADPRCHAVVVCGRNRRLRAALRRKRTSRLTVLGWVDDMAKVMAGVDVVVNNAGGVTTAEALASGRALVMFRPIAGHGRACATAMRRAGLATVAPRRRQLTELLAHWAADRAELVGARDRATRYARAHRLTDAAWTILEHAGVQTTSRLTTS